MHHFEKLEDISVQIRQALKPDGLLILNEYLGPSRFQFPARQKQIANLCLQLLPPKYRMIVQESLVLELDRNPFKKGTRWFVSRLIDKVRDGDLVDAIRRRLHARQVQANYASAVKANVTFPSQGDVIAADPSEAVRSDEILDVLTENFEIINRIELGGNILQFLLADIAGNFADAKDADSQILLKMLFKIEDTLLECGELSSDFAYIVARPLPK